MWFGPNGFEYVVRFIIFNPVGVAINTPVFSGFHPELFILKPFGLLFSKESNVEVPTCRDADKSVKSACDATKV